MTDTLSISRKYSNNFYFIFLNNSHIFELSGLVEREFSRHTYTKDSMCHSPANSYGYYNPGYTYDVLLRNLRPNTRYYYSYGTLTHMSDTYNFTTPLPKGDPTPFNFVIYGDMGVTNVPQVSHNSGPFIRGRSLFSTR